MIGTMFCLQLFNNLLGSEAYTKVAEYNDGITVAVSGSKLEGENRFFTSYLASSDSVVNQIAQAKGYVLSEEVICIVGTVHTRVWVMVRRVPDKI
jgi:hypothetical protein